MAEFTREELQRPLSDEEVLAITGRMAKFFTPENFSEKRPEILNSPSRNYTLEIENYQTSKGCWNYSQGIVKDRAGEILFKIQRNYCNFWHAWVPHPNGHEYLLCGEDYQGYTVVDLTARTKKTHLTFAATKGWGFCWASCDPSPDGTLLAVCGCYWGGPYDTLILDFSHPLCMPFPELARFEDGSTYDNENQIKWLDKDSYQLVRTVDPVEYVQDKDGDDELKTETFVWKRN